METENTSNNTGSFSLKARISDYIQLAKLRLATLVVYSAGLGYGLAVLNTDGVFEWDIFLYLIVGGFLVTGSSNGFNQVIEKDLDKKMERTKNRPLPTNRISILEGIIVSTVLGIIGLYLLYQINSLSFYLGLIALISYALIYTPLKRVTPLSVFVGAFPGSIPPMIGYIALTGQLGLNPGILFLVQFVWQFPHFWAIAWKSSEDYKRGGFKMLPFGQEKDQKTAFIIFFYTLFIIPAGMLPYAAGISGVVSMILSILLGIYFLRPAYNLYKSQDDKDALKLMFASFSYLPLVFLFYFIDKLILTLYF
jgi:protoheme IX farnesyltransferase